MANCYIHAAVCSKSACERWCYNIATELSNKSPLSLQKDGESSTVSYDKHVLVNLCPEMEVIAEKHARNFEQHPFFKWWGNGGVAVSCDIMWGRVIL